MEYFGDLIVDNFACGKTVARRTNSYFEGYYGIQFVYEGEIEVSIDGQEFERAAGPVIFLTYPGVRFSYGSPMEKIRLQANICFSGARAERYVEQHLFLRKKENIFFYPHSPQDLWRQMLELQRSLLLPDDYHQAHAVLLLEELLLQIVFQDSITHKTTSIYLPEFNKLIKAIAATPAEDWDFQQEAKKIGISPSHFRRIFKQITGFSPISYLIECRINSAKQLLLTSGKRVYEIGNELHFDNEFHFSRLFRKRVGKSPAQFRKFYS